MTVIFGIPLIDQVIITVAGMVILGIGVVIYETIQRSRGE